MKVCASVCMCVDVHGHACVHALCVYLGAVCVRVCSCIKFFVDKCVPVMHCLKGRQEMYSRIGFGMGTVS